MNFWIKLTQRGYFQSKKVKKKNENHHRILYIWIGIDSKFQLQKRTLIFQTNFPLKRIFLFENRKDNHHYWIMHIRISVGTKFWLKLTVFIFWTKFTKKWYFRSQTEKLNTAIEFCLFELVYVPNFSLNWQILIFPTKFAENFENRKVNFSARGLTDTTVFCCLSSF